MIIFLRINVLMIFDESNLKFEETPSFNVNKCANTGVNSMFIIIKNTKKRKYPGFFFM